VLIIALSRLSVLFWINSLLQNAYSSNSSLFTGKPCFTALEFSQSMLNNKSGSVSSSEAVMATFSTVSMAATSSMLAGLHGCRKEEQYSWECRKGYHSRNCLDVLLLRSIESTPNELRSLNI